MYVKIIHLYSLKYFIICIHTQNWQNCFVTLTHGICKNIEVIYITAAVFYNSVLAIDEQSKSILREQH